MSDFVPKITVHGPPVGIVLRNLLIYTVNLLLVAIVSWHFSQTLNIRPERHSAFEPVLVESRFESATED